MKVLRSVQPETLETVLAQMIRRLIRMKALDDWRVGGRFLLAIDGTGLYSFRRRHCERCIETHHDSGAITYKDSDMPALWTEAQSLLALCPGQCVTITLPRGEGTREVRWINELEYEGMQLSAVFQIDKDQDGNPVRRFAHLTGRSIDPSNAWKVAAAARLRWRCENEGFNVLKNGGFAFAFPTSNRSRNCIATSATTNPRRFGS